MVRAGGLDLRGRAAAAAGRAPVFLTDSLLVALTAPPSGPNGDRLVRGQREISPLRFEDDDGVAFHLSHSDWIALLPRHGFSIGGLHELYAPADASPPR